MWLEILVLSYLGLVQANCILYHWLMASAAYLHKPLNPSRSMRTAELHRMWSLSHAKPMKAAVWTGLLPPVYQYSITQQGMCTFVVAGLHLWVGSDCDCPGQWLCYISCVKWENVCHVLHFHSNLTVVCRLWKWESLVWLLSKEPSTEAMWSLVYTNSFIASAYFFSHRSLLCYFLYWGKDLFLKQKSDGATQ